MLQGQKKSKRNGDDAILWNNRQNQYNNLVLLTHQQCFLSIVCKKKNNKKITHDFYSSTRSKCQLPLFILHSSPSYTNLSFDLKTTTTTTTTLTEEPNSFGKPHSMCNVQQCINSPEWIWALINKVTIYINCSTLFQISHHSVYTSRLRKVG